MRSAVIFSFALVSFALTAYGCSASTRHSNDFNSGGGGSGGDSSGSLTGAGGVDLTTGSSSGSGGGGSGDCSAAAKLIYVLSDANELWSFDPQAKQFKKIGALGCNTAMQPNSMAVDRDATAWVNYVESDPLFGEDTAGAIFKVSTADASCQPTSIKLGQGWYRLGMGFSIDKMGSTDETLFVTGTSSTIGAGDSPGLGKIDFGTNTVVPIGQFTGVLAGESAELTGTGDARLFGFFTTTPVQVAEIDKATGATPKPKSLAQVQTPIAWAFSFWGGQFYLYTASDPLKNSNVTLYDPVAGTTDTSYVPDVGFRIVGAGVSTCAPVEIPK